MNCNPRFKLMGTIFFFVLISESISISPAEIIRPDVYNDVETAFNPPTIPDPIGVVVVLLIYL